MNGGRREALESEWRHRATRAGRRIWAVRAGFAGMVLLLILLPLALALVAFFFENREAESASNIGLLFGGAEDMFRANQLKASIRCRLPSKRCLKLFAPPWASTVSG